MGDVEQVGGKNASLGEMISQLARRAASASRADSPRRRFAFREFLAHNGLDARIAHRLAALDVDDVAALAKAGAEIRGWISKRRCRPRCVPKSPMRIRALADGGARRDVGGALVGDGRGPARGLVRRAAGNIS